MFRLFQNKKFVIIFLFLVAAVMGIFTFRSNAQTNRGNITGMITRPFQRIFSRASNNIDNAGVSLAELKEENAELRAELQQTREKLMEHEWYGRMEEDLLATLGLTNRMHTYERVQADVIQRDLGNFTSVYVLNRGSRDGVRNNNIVIFGNSVVGRIIWTGYNTSKLQLITDPASSVAGRITSNGDLVEVTGDIRYKSEGNAILRYITDAQVKVGDLIVTAGLGDTRFPRNLPLGQVVAKDENTLGESIAIIEPGVDLTRLETVFIMRERE